MKKLIFTVIAVIGFGFTSNAQCDAQSTSVTTDCGSYCVTYQMTFTGILQVDVALLLSSNGTMRRKPTLTEMLDFAAETC